MHELKSLKEECFAELLSRAPFLQAERGEFGNVVERYLEKHKHNQRQQVWMMVVDAKLRLLNVFPFQSPPGRCVRLSTALEHALLELGDNPLCIWPSSHSTHHRTAFAESAGLQILLFRWERFATSPPNRVANGDGCSSRVLCHDVYLNIWNFMSKY